LICEVVAMLSTALLGCGIRSGFNLLTLC